jgi:putative transposase
MHQRAPIFNDERARTILGNTMREIQAASPFEVVAIVLLPDHLHTIWTLPPGDADYSTRWKRIKAKFTSAWLAIGGEERPISRRRQERGSCGVWQRRFWEHRIDDEVDLENHCSYIHYNPIKHGLVVRPLDWPHSSFHRFVKQGEYEPDWGRTITDTVLNMNWE